MCRTIISTGSELNRFFTALVTGKLLPAPQLVQMEPTVPMSPSTAMHYGLGLIRFQIPCGTAGKDVKELWGHSGGIPGFTTLAIATPQGNAAAISINTSDTNDRFSGTVTAVACAIA
ncbi:serine hydrolase [Nocardia acidivorans]|uniref:serine hydrolase n=1 Tax=Nocardia acidivorans TaxID=404580 RepID=UPI0008313E9D|nr:serine hydrolase [Nocardia acidivorans]